MAASDFPGIGEALAFALGHCDQDAMKAAPDGVVGSKYRAEHLRQRAAIAMRSDVHHRASTWSTDPIPLLKQRPFLDILGLYFKLDADIPGSLPVAPIV